MANIRPITESLEREFTAMKPCDTGGQGHFLVLLLAQIISDQQCRLGRRVYIYFFRHPFQILKQHGRVPQESVHLKQWLLEPSGPFKYRLR